RCGSRASPPVGAAAPTRSAMPPTSHFRAPPPRYRLSVDADVSTVVEGPNVAWRSTSGSNLDEEALNRQTTGPESDNVQALDRHGHMRAGGVFRDDRGRPEHDRATTGPATGASQSAWLQHDGAAHDGAAHDDEARRHDGRGYDGHDEGPPRHGRPHDAHHL